jgi:hypothetical protein
MAKDFKTDMKVFWAENVYAGCLKKSGDDEKKEKYF